MQNKLYRAQLSHCLTDCAASPQTATAEPAGFPKHEDFTELTEKGPNSQKKGRTPRKNVFLPFAQNPFIN